MLPAGIEKAAVQPGAISIVLMQRDQAAADAQTTVAETVAAVAAAWVVEEVVVEEVAEGVEPHRCFAEAHSVGSRRD